MARYSSRGSRRTGSRRRSYSRPSGGRRSRAYSRRSGGRGRSVVTHRLVIETPRADQVTPASLADRFAANVAQQKASRQRF